MITARCNLSCSYCILENAPHQLKQELSLTQKKELISHLYHNLNFRSLTISGGEALIIGKSVPSDFLQLLNFLKQFKFDDTQKNLKIKLYTNGIYLTESVAVAMNGIIDEVSINIDSSDDETLLLIGRNKSKQDKYFLKVIGAIKLLFNQGIKVKLHTVISALNYQNIASEVRSIYNEVKNANSAFCQWKFYQYMSYDEIIVDEKHKIDIEVFESVKREIENNLKGLDVDIHFKNNQEMNQSLFNILATGIAQYRLPENTWTTTPRTENLLNYKSMEALFERNKIDVDLFNTYHSYKLIDATN
ncbi:MAG: radical SAM protein [Chitinophagaceae bacterium]|nr:radical SAM protein [Chitinophagaceae bacterium]